MRTSRFLLSTVKETPSEAEIASHRLMLRAGLIKSLASGLYNWLPTGLRVLKKVENIIREEMNKSGALEVLMPVVQPAELWQETGRFEQYGPELLRFNDRHQREFVLGPTHEEVITDIARREIKSYRQLPLNLYQIQTKFRDEIRPRFGIMRSREFIMKDAYSFHLSQESLQETYDAMYKTYCSIFSRCGLDYRPVAADTGSIGGSLSHEFHVLADSGEDAIAFSDNGDYAANVELAEAVAIDSVRPEPQIPMQKVPTPEQKTIDQIVNYLEMPVKKTVKTIVIEDSEQKVFALVLRGDHSLNEVKVSKLSEISPPFHFADDKTIRRHTNADPGSIGPAGLEIPVIADKSAALLSDFVCGANENDQHFIGVNWARDAKEPIVADIRNVEDGDLSPDGKGRLKIARGIEVGHIFQLGNKYSKSLDAKVLDENGKAKIMTMGCYGIGVTRIVAAAIEQHHDDKGIVWPEAIAPFTLALVPINMHKSDSVKAKVEELYQRFSELGIEVLLDDRKESPGVMFADMELIGIPHRLTIGERGLKNGKLEYKYRADADNTEIAVEAAVEFIQSKLEGTLN